MFFGVVLLSIAIAFALIGREGRREERVPNPVVFDMEEAVAWIADHLPEEMQAELSYDDVRKIVFWNIEFMRSRGVIANGHAPNPTTTVVVGGAEAVEYVLNKAKIEELEISSAHVHAVLEAQVGYLEFIGAIGPEAPEDPT